MKEFAVAAKPHEFGAFIAVLTADDPEWEKAEQEANYARVVVRSKDGVGMATKGSLVFSLTLIAAQRTYVEARAEGKGAVALLDKLLKRVAVAYGVAV